MAGEPLVEFSLYGLIISVESQQMSREEAVGKFAVWFPDARPIGLEHVDRQEAYDGDPWSLVEFQDRMKKLASGLTSNLEPATTPKLPPNSDRQSYSQ